MENKKRRSMLDFIEAAGNNMPHALMFFLWMGVLFVILSVLGGTMGWSATGLVLDNKTGETVEQTVTMVNVLSRSGLSGFLNSFIGNVTGFAALGIYLVISVGLVTAEKSGYLEIVIKRLIGITPAMLLTPVVVFLGIMSNIGSVVGYVVIPPLAAIMFKHHGRHPLAGMCAAFAGAAGGFSANLLIGPIDPLMSGITTQCAQIVDPDYIVNPTDNWYIMVVSTIFLTLVGTWLTDKVVEPRLRRSSPDVDMTVGDTSDLVLTETEQKGMKTASITFAALILLIVAVCIPQNSFLRNPQTGSLLSGSPLMNGIIPIITLIFFIPGAIYGRITGVFKNSGDICRTIVESQKSCADVLAMAFVAGQVLWVFDASKLGNFLALRGADLLSSANIWPPLLLIVFAAIAFILNIFLPSAAGKLLILGPVFIPMFMMLGISPAMSQFAYRIGDSCCNCWTPLNAYTIMLVAAGQKYDKNLGMGTIVAAELPYALGFFVVWSVVMVIWMLLGLPIGPGVSVYM